jgi:RimJ/RimL family protein N-acetyltransferase
LSIVCGQKERVGAWVGARIGNAEPWHNYEAIGIEHQGELVGGVVIDNYITAARCSIHCAGAGRRWLTREFLFVVFDYVFRQLGCNAVVNIVDGSNADSIRFTGHLGFSIVHRIKGGGKGGSDGVIFELQKSDCKWTKVKK